MARLGPGLAAGVGDALSPCSRVLDCFFQLGNLAFAEADYKQALALSPQDEGANLRMGVLQEKMGFCEQTRRCLGVGRGVAREGGRQRSPEATCWLSAGQRFYSHRHHK